MGKALEGGKGGKLDTGGGGRWSKMPWQRLLVVVIYKYYHTLCVSHTTLFTAFPGLKNGRLGVKTLAEGFQNTPNSHRVFLKVT